MASRTLVFHNGYNFDTIALEQHGVRFDPAQLEDTMIASHAFASHFPKRLDHVVSMWLDSSPWKVTFGRRGAEEKGLAHHKMPPEELCLYNSVDASHTARSWDHMQGDLDAERTIYEHDKKLSWICRRMHIDGIAFDRKRRSELRREMRGELSKLLDGMRRMTGRRDFHPRKLDQVRWALFDHFGAPIFSTTGTGLPSTSGATLEALRASPGPAGKLATKILLFRAIDKVKGTYLDAIEPGNDNRVHFTWKPTGTVSGRWSCRFQSVPRWNKKRVEDRVRECYVAGPGKELGYFDVSQGEMRAAAFLSGDQEFIKTCKGDVHSGNAGILFPQAALNGWLEGDPSCLQCKKGKQDAPCTCPKKDPARGKQFRDIAKNAGFGILYSAKIDTIYQFLIAKGFKVSLSQVKAMFDLIHKKYKRYYEYCEDNLTFCQTHGYQRTSILGRIRRIGYFPEPGDVYNFKVQSLIADIMNIRLIELWEVRLADLVKSGKVCVVAQVHDALTWECDEGPVADRVEREVKALWAEDFLVPDSGLRMVLPIDYKRGHRMSDFG